MNKIERIKCVKAMEFLARQINDEEIFEEWLMDYYIEDEHFADLMDTFVHIIARARKSGGLYCDGIVSKRCVA